MSHGQFRLLTKPLILLILMAILFLIVTLRMYATLLPHNEILIKLTRELIDGSPGERDWHDYKSIYMDARRSGIGEQGQKAVLSNRANRKLQLGLARQYGFNALLSDSISVYRSVPDVRDEGCIKKKYLSKLPTATVVIAFHNEYFSVLVRTLHSVINRSPEELIHEIVLVDDFSQRAFLGRQLEQYAARYFDKVKIIRLPEKMGLIRARMAGARKATADVLVFLDSHVEVNQNWLPPLLEPIANDKRTVACPLIDTIHYNNFEYQYQQSERGGFDWSFYYTQLELLAEDLLASPQPYRNPIMNGGLFAISAEFFWELDGYDEGPAYTTGDEQFELSFKIWMCGGKLLNVPCSRVGHLTSDKNFQLRQEQESTNDVLKNHKRIAEVWMDDYKKFLYARYNGAFDVIDAGNLTKQMTLRQKLQCKSFKWFMEEVAFDVLKQHPPVDPPDYASGTMQNVGAPHLCIDTLGHTLSQKVGLKPCAKNTTSLDPNQQFVLSWRRDLRSGHSHMCLDILKRQQNAEVLMLTCRAGNENQFWYYDPKQKFLINGKEEPNKFCLIASVHNNEVFVGVCQKDNPYMQWNFSAVNITAIDSFWENVDE